MATFENGNSGGDNSSNSEDTPFAVGSNITLQLPADSNPPSDSSEPFAVGTNMTIQFTDNSGQPQGEQLSSDNIVGTNSAPWGDRGGSSEGGDSLIGTGNSQPPTGDSASYTWDFSGAAGGGESAPSGGSAPGGESAPDGGNTGSGGSSDMDSLFRQSPWGSLQEVGIDNFEEVFGNVGGAGGGENPFGGGGASSGGAGGSNPFGGGGAGGGENPFGGGGAGGGENPFGGGGAGGGNPFSGGGGFGGGFM